jgi:hypothetical protein
MTTPASLARAALAALALLAAACGGGGDGTVTELTNEGPPLGQVPPAFSLPDVNPASATYATNVSPSQTLGSVSLWYFGHAT